MRYLFVLICVLVAAGVFFAAYVRFVPLGGAQWSDPDRALRAVGDYRGEKTFEAVRRVNGPEVLAQLNAVALATPRTQVLASENGEWATYVTRSRVMGYPDYTSVRVVETDTGAALQIYARSRFGKLDLGVNKARVLDWLGQLDLLTPQG